MKIDSSHSSKTFQNSGVPRFLYGNLRLSLLEQCLQIEEDGHSSELDYLDVQQVQSSIGLIWDELRIQTANRLYRVVHQANAESRHFQQQLQNKIRHALKSVLKTSFEQALEHPASGFDPLSEQYLSQSRLQQAIRTLSAQWQGAKWMTHPVFSSLKAEDFGAEDAEIWQQVQLWQARLDPQQSWLQTRNQAFVAAELASYADFFAQIETYPLTQEQQRAVVTDEDRNLLIASAGSGKSSTLVAKVAYLLHKGLARPEQICVLAYNEEAASSIAERIARMQNKLGLSQERVYSATFHALGLEIIRQQQGQAPRLSPLASASRSQMLSYFQHKVNVLLSDAHFAQAWYDYLAIAKKPRPDLFRFSSQKAYYDYLAQMGASYATAKDGKKRPVLTALNGIKVSSLESLYLANWLIAQGVEFRYLHPLAGSQNRTSLADFYYPDADLYHFHFALNAVKQWPKFLPDYGRFIDQRRQAAKRLKVQVFETTSYQFDQGTILTELKQILIKAGVRFAPLSDEALSEMVNRTYRPEEDLTIFEVFLRHFKANGADFTAFDQQLAVQEVADPIRTTLFLEVFNHFYAAYQHDLNAQGEIDFNDQINLACQILERQQYQHAFTYILVDEFQDISQDRKRLLQALLAQNPHAKLMAVGDDWQSIYRFSGADIDIMTHFSRHFGYSSLGYLTQTFRCYQGIADVAAEFVQQNPQQLPKKVHAHADIALDPVQIEAYESESEQIVWVERLLYRLQQLALKKGVPLTVFLLARYHRQKPDNLAHYQLRFAPLQIAFKSIHASKGLEADYVILLGLEAGAYGFPSERSDDPILHLVIPQPEAFAHAEERRLMYVALTRAKRGVFLLASASDQSEFVAQLSKFKRVKCTPKLVEATFCPKCHSGKLNERRGQYSIFLGCSNYPACDYTERKICPKCEQGSLVARESDQGRFYGCSHYPKCKHIEQ
ncbi:MAG: UvrD-helicase domain-containing protein [Thiotrichales bacterium]|nr:UvrD-helicase domain-containing protein [Thiotrichales bacterium]